MKYNIYPKTTDTDTPATISIECDGWQRDGSLIRPINELGQLSESGLLTADNIASIVPEDLTLLTPQINNPLHFQLYLRGRTQPLVVPAHIVRLANDQLEFLWLVYDMQTSARTEHIISEIYVVASEVIAVLPSGKLPARNLP